MTFVLVLGAALLTAAGARQVCERSAKETPDEEFIGIPAELAELVNDALTVLSAYIWHPYVRRLTIGRDLRRLNKTKDAATAEMKKSSGAVNWDWGLPSKIARG